MSRIPRFLVDPDKPESIVQQMEEIHRVADGDIGFGHPNDPNSIGSTTAAGAADVNHNGTLENITGSWVEATFTAFDTKVLCHHNLFREWPDYVLPVTGEPNVRWLNFGMSHDGAEQLYWDDLRAPGTTGVGGGAPPIFGAFGADGVTGAYLFDPKAGGAAKEMYFTLQLPHAWREGTNLQPHVHWAPVDTGTGTVIWDIDYMWANPGDVFPATVTSISSSDLVAGGAMGAAWRHNITGNYTEIDGTDKTLSAQLMIRLSLNRSSTYDTLNGVALMEFDIHYQIDSRGSEAVFAKDPIAQEHSAPSVVYIEADSGSLTENAIPLRLRAGPGMEITGSPVTVTLFFIPAVKAPLETAP
jgi:hypothetical protein